MKWCTLAAKQGNAGAQSNLGEMYRKGQGVPQNDKTAVKWYRLAAKQGIADAQYALSVFYDLGEGVPEDPKLATKWATLAAEQGHAKARLALAYRFVSPTRTALAVACAEGSLETGMTNEHPTLGLPAPRDFQKINKFVESISILNVDVKEEVATVEIHVKFKEHNSEPLGTLVYSGECGITGMRWKVGGTVDPKYLEHWR